ncbi:MAG: molybdenum cofactor biosynthesis protein MoaE [Chromatiales bacterium]|nr:molybdenum cofactor biosynthesis protein MoaE [Chromatiales bacterium]
MTSRILTTPLEPWAALADFERQRFAGSAAHGASAVFVGTMRDLNEGDEVHGMILEHYPGMTDGYLERLREEAAKRWELLETLVLHRVGELNPGDPIVLVAVWSAHRTAAFDACRWIMEELKSRAPFWKRETLAQGSRWVEHNTPG